MFIEINLYFEKFVKFLKKLNFSCVDQITTRTYNHEFVISNYLSPLLFDITQSLVQFSSSLITQLINGFSRVL